MRRDFYSDLRAGETSIADLSCRNKWRQLRESYSPRRGFWETLGAAEDS